MIGTMVIGGRRVPVLAIGGAAVVLLLFFVLRRRGKAAAVAVAPAPAGAAYDPSLAAYDPNASALSAISSGFADLQNQVYGLQASAAAAAAAPPPAAAPAPAAPAPVPMPAPAPPTPAPTPPPALPIINHDLFPHLLPGGSNMDILGTITQSGNADQFVGRNVTGQAPVWALINGMWEQGYNVHTLVAGTPLATLPSLSAYETQGVVTEHLD